jgi:hypothetical protein
VGGISARLSPPKSDPIPRGHTRGFCALEHAILSAAKNLESVEMVGSASMAVPMLTLKAL